MPLVRYLPLGLVALLLASALSLPVGARAQAAPGPYVPGEVVVKLFSADDLSAVTTSYGLDPAPLDQFGARPIFRLRILDGSDPQAKADQLAGASGGDPRVEFAEPNFFADAPEVSRGRSGWAIGGDAGEFAAQWAPEKIRLAEAHQITRGAGVTVAVLDTGIDPDHPFFAGRLTPGFDFVEFDSDPREEGAYQLNAGFGHGTHVAGLVALAAPEAKIMPVRVLDADGVGNIWVLSEGLLYAVDPDGDPATPDGAAVINLSLGTLRRTDLLRQIVAEVTCERVIAADDDNDASLCDRWGGAVVVAAAGNGGDRTPYYPAAEGVKGSMAVAASTPEDTLASFSTRGPWVHLAAPGERVISTVPGGGYGVWSGTSMAAPLTSGVMALVRSSNQGLSAPHLVARLVKTAPTISGMELRRLDAAAALRDGKRRQNSR